MRNELGQFVTTEPLDEPLSKKVTGVRLPISIQDCLDSLDSGDRIKLIRSAIIEAVKKHEKTIEA